MRTVPIVGNVKVTATKDQVVIEGIDKEEVSLNAGRFQQAAKVRFKDRRIFQDGIYVFETTALPAGSYEGKVALNESWDENYGQGGAPGGANYSFFVPFDNAKVIFTYNASTHVLVIETGFMPDGNIALDGLRHDSRDPLYRTPGGAVPAGTEVLIRFRTFHNDVTGVFARPSSSPRHWPMPKDLKGNRATLFG